MAGREGSGYWDGGIVKEVSFVQRLMGIVKSHTSERITRTIQFWASLIAFGLVSANCTTNIIKNITNNITTYFYQ